MSTNRIGDLDSLSEQFTAIKDESESLVEKLFFDGVLAIIDCFPIVDPETLPIVQELRAELAKRPPAVHSNWGSGYYNDFGEYVYPCEECGEESNLLSPYCPNCGAIMDEEAKAAPKKEDGTI